MSAPIYFDYNATTPVEPVVADATEPYLNLSFPDVDGRELLLLDTEEIVASVGSTCHEEGDTVSRVLDVMGIATEQARGGSEAFAWSPCHRC